MANINAPFGLSAIGGMGSSYETSGTSKYQINVNLANGAGYASSIFKGDLVYAGDTGNDAAGNASVAGFIAPSDNAETRNVGVFNGCFYQDATNQKPQWRNYYPGGTTAVIGTNIDAFVYDDPKQLYLIQANGVFAQAAMMSNADIVYAAGATINGQSLTEMGATAGAATAAQLRVIRVSEDPSNSDLATTDVNVVVRLNESIYNILA
jgi:hypothetical protein